MWDTILQGRPWRGELINRKKDGSFHVEMIIITAVTDTSGRPTHYIALKEDISERKRAEAELRKLSRAVDQAPLSVVITDLSGAIEYVNPWFTKLTGYTFDEVRGKNPRVLKSGETPGSVYTEMWRTLGRGETWRGELYNRKKNGDIYCEAVVISPIAGADGVATHYVAIKEDITDRKRAEAALRESEARFRDLFDLESDTILLLEADTGKILQANRAASELYGYAVEQLLAFRRREAVEVVAQDLGGTERRSHRRAEFMRSDGDEPRLHLRNLPFALEHRHGFGLEILAARDVADEGDELVRTYRRRPQLEHDGRRSGRGRQRGFLDRDAATFERAATGIEQR
jgi:PAS domain S-box-containing protein